MTEAQRTEIMARWPVSWQREWSRRVKRLGDAPDANVLAFQAVLNRRNGLDGINWRMRDE